MLKVKANLLLKKQKGIKLPSAEKYQHDKNLYTFSFPNVIIYVITNLSRTNKSAFLDRLELRLRLEISPPEAAGIKASPGSW